MWSIPEGIESYEEYEREQEVEKTRSIPEGIESGIHVSDKDFRRGEASQKELKDGWRRVVGELSENSKHPRRNWKSATCYQNDSCRASQEASQKELKDFTSIIDDFTSWFSEAS